MSLKITDSETLLDLMIEAEDFLENTDLYAFENWFDGEIVDGPHVSKYWFSFSLMYDYDSMPDPAGGIRLVTLGVKVEYQEIEVEDISFSTKPGQRINIDSLSTISSGQAAQGMALNQVLNGQTNKKYDKKWLVNIKIPMQFINDMTNINLDKIDSAVEQELLNTYSKDEDINKQAEENDNDIF